MKFSLCLLCYGDHPRLAQRLLESIRVAYDPAFIQDVRIGLNEVSQATKSIVESWSRVIGVTHRTPITIYESPQNAGKYPLMRKMFHEGLPLADHVMWFDDDSFICRDAAGNELFRRCAAQLVEHRCICQVKRIRKIYPEQVDWIKAQPWYADVAIGRLFPQGSWWCLRRETIKALDWPNVWLHHRGGDVMLGRALEQTALGWHHDSSGVCLNCDEAGRDSASPRRGLQHEPPVGVGYRIGDQPDPRLHEFVCKVYPFTQTVGSLPTVG